MATFGYLVFLVRASIPHRSRALYLLDSCGENRDDLFEVMNRFIDEMGDSYHSVPDAAEGFRVKKVDRFNRATGLRINKGPAGGRGEAYNTETEESIETGETTALLSGLRAKLYVPAGSYFGLLFVERVGGRHLKPAIYDHVLKPAALATRTMVRVEGFAEAGDWESDLAGQQVLRISEVLAAPTGASDASTADDTQVRIVTTGTAVQRASDAFKDLILSRVFRRDKRNSLLQSIAPKEQQRRIIDEAKSESMKKPVYKQAPRASFTVQDEAEYKALKNQLDALDVAEEISENLMDKLERSSPVDRTDLKTVRFDVAMGKEHPERTFIVEGDAMPQFVYETNGRLTDDQMKEVWDHHATKILKNLNVSLETKWLEKVGLPSQEVLLVTQA